MEGIAAKGSIPQRDSNRRSNRLRCPSPLTGGKQNYCLRTARIASYSRRGPFGAGRWKMTTLQHPFRLRELIVGSCRTWRYLSTRYQRALGGVQLEAVYPACSPIPDTVQVEWQFHFPLATLVRLSDQRRCGRLSVHFEGLRTPCGTIWSYHMEVISAARSKHWV